MDTITIDGVDEDEFRREIEANLRGGNADAAVERLRSLLTPYATKGGFLPPSFLAVRSADVGVTGWPGLAEALARNDRGERRVSALGFHLVEPVPPEGSTERLLPILETTYYSDDAYPFSDATRDDLLDGYSKFGCQWQGDCEAADQAIAVTGLEDLHRAVQHLEAQLLATDMPSEDGIRAGTLAACYVSVLLHQALRDTIQREGLPRPLSIMAGEDGLYPCFDAPVISSVECVELGVAVAPGVADVQPGDDDSEDAADCGLLGLASRRGTKQPVLVLDEAEAHAAAEVYELVMAQQAAAPGAIPSYNPFAESHPFAPARPSEPDLPAPEPGGSEAQPEPELAEWPEVPVDRSPFEPDAEAAGWNEPEPIAPAYIAAEPEMVPDPEPAPQPVLRAVTGHSLRARVIQSAAAPSPPPAPGPLAALWRLLLGTFKRN